MKKLTALRLFIGCCLIFALSLLMYWRKESEPAANSELWLIEWGWDTPLIQQMPQYIDAIQTQPFDGAIFDVENPAQPGANTGLSWTLFTNQTPVDQQNLEQVSTQFADFEWGRLTHNFLRLNAMPGDVDWFEDWSVLLNNVELWARLAYDLGFVGIMFDIEQYGGTDLYVYSAQPESSSRSYEEYASKVYQRGQAVMAALNRGYPDITVMFSFGYSIGAEVPFSDHSNFIYGLLYPFLDGMMSASTPQNTLIEGYERSYVFHTEAEFEQARQWFEKTHTHYLPENPSYADKMELAFGLWIDPRCDLMGKPPDCAFSPEQFYAAVQHAIKYSDGYVWIYSEQMNWYETDGITTEWSNMMRKLRN